MYRALVIGCGRIGSAWDEGGSPQIDSHAGAYHRCERVVLAGLCDSDLSRVKQAAECWGGVESFTDVREALAHVRPDIVSICTPNHTHADVLRAVISSPGIRGILAEKPLAVDFATAAGLAEEAAQKGIALLINYSRRYLPSYRRVKQNLLDGRIGRICGVMGCYSRGMFHNGTHWLDLARWLIGEVRCVDATVAVDEIQGDPTLDVRMVFENGTTGFLKGVDQRNYALFEMDILGVKGRLRLLGGPRFEWTTAKPSDRYAGFSYLEGMELEETALESAMISAVNHVIDCLEGQAQPWCTGADGCAALRIAESALKSAQSGREQMVSMHNP